MKKILKSFIAVFALFTTLFTLVGCDGNQAQKGWDTYAGDLKEVLEENLTLEYFYVDDGELNAYFYRGRYGSFIDSDRLDNTSFYFAYQVETGKTIDITSEQFRSLMPLAKKSGTLITNN